MIRALFKNLIVLIRLIYNSGLSYILMIQKTILLFAIIQSIFGYQVSDFKPSLFFFATPNAGFFEVNTGPDNIGKILAYVDLNGDHFTDYIAIPNSTENNLYAYLWNEKQDRFDQDKFTLDKNQFQQITEIMANDINGDGRPEIIVTFMMSAKNYTVQIYQVSECTHSGKFSCKYPQWTNNEPALQNMTSVPFLLDKDGNGQVQLFKINGRTRELINLDRQKQFNISSFQSSVNDMEQTFVFNQIDKHFATIIDFDGDCQADLILVSKDNNNNTVFQFYLKNSNSKYGYLGNYTYTNQMDFMTFSDIDGSGTADMILIASVNGLKKLLVDYNGHSPKTLCKGSGSIPYVISELQQITIANGYTPSEIVHFAQINNDGYPDLLGIFQKGSSKKVGLLMNQINNGKSTFPNIQKSEAIYQIQNPIQTSLIDLGEDGKLDLIIITDDKASSNTSQTYKIVSVMNNLKEDALFIKILPLSPSSAYQAGSYDISSTFGVTIQWEITKLDGSQKIQTLFQKPQWNYGALPLPYVVGGLGRTNNYIEDLTVGYEGAGNKQSWTPVIPNSQLMVYKQRSQWKLQTLLSNNLRNYAVIFVSLIILLVLLIVIGFLTYRESKEDRRDHYNFIQLIR